MSNMFLLALASLLWAIATAQDPSAPAFPTNTSTYQSSTNTSQQVVLGLPITQAGPNDPPITALTQQASDIIPRDPSTLRGIGDHIWDTNPGTSKNVSDPANAIAFISCDGPYNGNIPMSQVLDDVIALNVTSVLFYSTTQNFCQLRPNLPQSQSQFARYYSMVNITDSVRVSQSLSGMLSSHSGNAEIMTAAAYTNVLNTSQNSQGINSTPSTAVAMIILYSITGVITALFLVIIVTGAVRAHRHPERYGPQNVLGRPRQSRAKGLARAMLDTIPIVKFGDQQQQQAKPGDIEMGGESSRNATAQENNNTDGSQHQDKPNSDEAAGENGANAAASGSDGQPKDDQADGEVSCSICTEDFEKGQDIRVLPCNHKFHPACVDPWLLDVSGTCPLCRVDLRPEADKETPEEREERHTRENAARDERQRGGRGGRGNGQPSTVAERDEAPLPPPLREGRNRRRDTILNLIDVRRMQGANPEERLSALRRLRQANRRSRPPVEEINQHEPSQATENTPSGGEHTSEAQENTISEERQARPKEPENRPDSPRRSASQGSQQESSSQQQRHNES